MGVTAPLGVAEFTPPPAGDRANAVVSGAFVAVGPSKPINIVGWANLMLWASFNTALTTTAGSTAATVASAGTIAAGAAINGANVPRGTTVGAIVGTAVTLALPSIVLSGFLQSNGIISRLTSTAGLLGAAVSGPGIPAGATVSAIITPAISSPSFQGGQSQFGKIQLSTTATVEQTFRDRQAFTFGLTGNAVSTGVDNAALFTGAGITWSATIQLERSFDGGATFIVCNIGGAGTMAQFLGGTPISTLLSEPESGVLYRFNCCAYTSGVINYRISTTGSAGGSLPTGGNI